MRTVYTPEQAAAACVDSSIVQLFFSRPAKGVDETKARIRAISLKGQPYYHIEVFTHNQAFQKNSTAEACSDILPEFFRKFRTIECCGAHETLFFLQNSKGRITLTKRALRTTDVKTAQQLTAHDKAKDLFVQEGTPLPFLIAQGLMNAEGLFIKKKYHKLRQINKFLEFIAGIEPVIRNDTANSPAPFTIIDFGCGKAYLSFALYYYLHECKGLPVRIHGLDLKTEVVSQCAALAQECGYEGLTFEQGDIADYPLPRGTGMMVCLHACNTATDLALAQAVRQQVPVIFAVPCCQHELYAQLKAQKESFRGRKHLLLSFMEHGIITERFASLLTDTIRALLLQACGYTVCIMEFIETEHTPKNILIHAVKKSKPLVHDIKMREEALQKYRAIKDSFAIEPSLEKLLIASNMLTGL